MAVPGKNTSTSARLIVVGAMIAVMTAFSLLNAAGFFTTSWRSHPYTTPDRAGQIGGILNDAVERTPAGSTVLVLFTPEDFRELAYSFYHSPPTGGMPEKLPLSSPEKQLLVPVGDRRLILIMYDPARHGVVKQSIDEYNGNRTEDVIEYAVAVSRRYTSGDMTTIATLFDAGGKELK